MRKLIDRIAHRLGFVRWERTIQGEVKFERNEQPFVDLKLPGGQRLSGWVDNRLSLINHGDNPAFGDFTQVEKSAMRGPSGMGIDPSLA